MNKYLKKTFLKDKLLHFCSLWLLTCLLYSCTNYDEINPVQENGIWISHKSGFYKNPLRLELKSLKAGHKIFYTLDGSEPTINATEYLGPIIIEPDNEKRLSYIPTTVLKGRWHLDQFIWKEPQSNPFSGKIIRCRAFDGDEPIGDISSQTYLMDSDMNEKYSFPIISIITDKDNLFGYDKGIYVPGRLADSIPWTKKTDGWWPPGNYQQKGKLWERPAHIEWFEPSGESGFSINAGIRITGAVIGGFPIKSLRIVTREKYGKKQITYPVFPDLEVTSFKRLLLRNSGQDFLTTLFRDALLQSILKPLDMELQASRPSLVFINGEYWGIHNVREKIDKHYIKSHFNLKENEFDIVEVCGRKNHGDNRAYKQLKKFIRDNDMTLLENYTHVTNQIDIDNYINHLLVELYFGNEDWPANNIKIWKPKSSSGKWRWLIFDLDISFGYKSLGSNSKVDFNAIEHATAVNSTHWSNYGCSTFMLRKLLKNTQFKSLFITRYLELSQSIFSPENIIKQIDQFESLYEVEMEEHISRWNYPKSMKYWRSQIEVMRSYARNRPKHFKQHLEEYLGVPLNAYEDRESPTH